MRVWSRRALARELGRDRRGVDRAAVEGRIQPEEDGSWDVERCRRDLAATSSRISGNGHGGTAAAFEVEKIRLMRTKADEVEEKLRVRRREVVDRDRAKRLFSGLGQLTQATMLLDVPPLLARRLAAEFGLDEPAVRRRVEAVMREHARGFADRAAALDAEDLLAGSDHSPG